MDLLFSFSGRIPRSSFWMGQIIMLVIGMIIAAIAVAAAYALGFFDQPPPEPGTGVIVAGVLLYALFIIFGIWAGLAIQIKRWHDRNKSGWWWLIGFIPIVGSIWALVECGCLRGTDGPNDYGPDPLEG